MNWSTMYYDTELHNTSTKYISKAYSLLIGCTELYKKKLFVMDRGSNRVSDRSKLARRVAIEHIFSHHKRYIP